MSKNACRMGDLSTGHSPCFPPRPNYQGSEDVLINKRKAHRQGDKWFPHTCPGTGTHDGVLAAGSSTVYINGKQAARIGDSISCGDFVMTGSGDVLIGD